MTSAKGLRRQRQQQTLLTTSEQLPRVQRKSLVAGRRVLNKWRKWMGHCKSKGRTNSRDGLKSSRECSTQKNKLGILPLKTLMTCFQLTPTTSKGESEERNQPTKAQQLPWHGCNSAEMQGSRRDCNVKRLRRLCHQVWTSGDIPADWKNVSIVCNPKKGNPNVW